MEYGATSRHGADALNRLSRHLLVRFVAVVAIGLACDMASACERCRIAGTAAFHISPIGGDDLNDAIIPPRPPADATAQFTLGGGQWPQPGGLGTPVTLTYSYQNMFDGGLKMPDGQPLPNSVIRSSIEEALQLWASAAPLHFVEVPDQGGVTFGDYPNGQFGQIRFRHVYINGPDIPGQSPIAKAQAYFPFTGGNLAGDVEFDNSDPWQEIGTLPMPDVLGAAIHEVGHTLGLHHTDVVGANMYWIFHRFAGPGTGELFPDDIAGIRAIYGAGVGSVTPLAVPEPATWVIFIATILAWQTASRVVLDRGCRAAHERRPNRPL
jgi:Matrixin